MMMKQKNITHHPFRPSKNVSSSPKTLQTLTRLRKQVHDHLFERSNLLPRRQQAAGHQRNSKEKAARRQHQYQYQYQHQYQHQHQHQSGGESSRRKKRSRKRTSCWKRSTKITMNGVTLRLKTRLMMIA
jgi:hypothetical protein